MQITALITLWFSKYLIAIAMFQPSVQLSLWLFFPNGIIFNCPVWTRCKKEQGERKKGRERERRRQWMHVCMVQFSQLDYLCMCVRTHYYGTTTTHVLAAVTNCFERQIKKEIVILYCQYGSRSVSNSVLIHGNTVGAGSTRSIRSTEQQRTVKIASIEVALFTKDRSAISFTLCGSFFARYSTINRQHEAWQQLDIHRIYRCAVLSISLFGVRAQDINEQANKQALVVTVQPDVRLPVYIGIEIILIRQEQRFLRQLSSIAE